jgi:RNA polymerase sigma-70 factor (ECF subfamily)
MLVEIEVIKRAQQGDASAFDELVRVYRKRILGTIYRLTSRSEDVEDVGQDVFVRLYFSLNQLRSPEVFEPWLYRLTVNAAYDYLRKKRRNPSVRMADLSEEQLSAADAAASGKQLSEDRQKGDIVELTGILLDQVSEEDRILLTLKEVEGLSLKELEKIYEVNENALKVRLFRARKRVLRAYERLKKRHEV